MRRDLRGVASAAFAVALRAKCDRLTVQDVRQLAVQAECLPEEHTLRAGVCRFADEYQRDRHLPEAMTVAGDRLAACVTAALAPAPVGMDRKDIHG